MEAISPGPQTTYGDVISHFVSRSARAQRELARWRNQPDKRAAVVPYVEGAVTRAAYSVTPADVETACRETEHALGRVSRAVAESVPEIVDWHPAFAFHHVLHHVLETKGSVPTYQLLRRAARDSPLVAAMLAEPARNAVSGAVLAGHDRAAAAAAVRWRVGNAYLSFMRELYVLATLRADGVDARYHVLADVLLRVDLWVAQTCVSLHVANRKFRQGASGRKTPAAAIIGDGPFTFALLELAPRREFGTVHLPKRGEILRAVEALRDG